MLRRSALAGLACATILGGGCSLLFPASPPAVDGGAEGEVGSEGEGEDVFAIVAVDGDGTARPIVGDRPGGVDGVDAAHRVAARLRVTFSGAAAVTAARISDGSVERDAVVETTEEGVAFVTVPDTTPVGRVVLLTLLSGAASAQTQLFFLQGEQGPPGPAGANALVALEAADVDACPLGGRRTRSFTDLDGDGAFTAGEPSVTRDECDDIVKDVRVVDVDDEAALLATLQRLSGVRLAPGAQVTLQLPAGVLAMSAPVIVDHVDGERIVLAGDPAGTTTLAFPDDGNGLVVRGGLRLQQLTIDSPSPDVQTNLAGIGLFVADGGFVVVESTGSVVVTGFDVGVQADEGGVLTTALTLDDAGAPVRTLQAIGNSVGFNVGGGGVLQIPGALARDSSSGGFLATGGSLVANQSSSENASSFGYLAQFGAYLEAARSTSTVLGTGSAAYFSANGGALSCNNSTGSIIAGTGSNARALFVANGAFAICVKATMNGNVTAVNGATAITNNTVGTGLSINATNNATMVHNCNDANANAAGCNLVACVNDGTSRCIGP